MRRYGQLVILLVIWGRAGETQLIYPTLDLAPAPKSILEPAIIANPTSVPSAPIRPSLSLAVPAVQDPRPPPKGSLATRPTTSRQTEPRKFNAVWAKVRRGVNTECKTCPDSLCANKDWYGSAYQFRTTCYTTGSIVNNTNQWMRSEANCYVSQFDLLPYHRTDTADLKTCPGVDLDIIQSSYTVPITTQCRMCPHERCDIVQEYKQGKQTRVVCEAAPVLEQCMTYCPRSEYTAETQWLLGNTTEPAEPEWYKTEDNCYIHTAKLKIKRDSGSLRGWAGLRKLGLFGGETEFEKLYAPDCGPVPFLSLAMHAPPPPKLTPTKAPSVTEAPWSPPPTATCLTCDPFIWTMPLASALTTTVPCWPFSPSWLSLATSPSSSPKLETSHVTIPLMPETTPTFPGLSTPTPAPIAGPPPGLSYPTLDLAPSIPDKDLPASPIPAAPPPDGLIYPILDLAPFIPDTPAAPEPPTLELAPIDASLPLASVSTASSPPLPAPQPAQSTMPAGPVPSTRETSQDGTCGGPRGLACPVPSCCSQWYFCGSTDSHCGKGCNPAFGRCG